MFVEVGEQYDEDEAKVSKKFFFNCGKFLSL